MSFELPALPYAVDALAPTISAETIEFHYGKHHQSYVDNLNRMVDGTAFAEGTLEEVIAKSDGVLFNNAAQVWNHTFYWQCMTPDAVAKPSGDLSGAIDEAFGSMGDFKEAFIGAAKSNFGSGWTWLTMGAHGKLEVVNTSNADTPVANGRHPLLTCDVWEHAYYIDYRNARPKYLEAWWDVIDWNFVQDRFASHGA
jgi:Fe-Mn family superoxide dismutase